MSTSNITHQRIAANQRINHTAQLFGLNFPMRLEPTIFSIAGNLASEYDGGFWEFYKLSNGGFYMAPASEEQFSVSADNGYEGSMSADALGITACLYAYSHLSFGDGAFAETAFSKLAAPPNVPSKPELLHSTNAVGLLQYLALGYGVYLAFSANILFGFVVLVLLYVFWNKFTSALKSNRDGEHKEAEATYARKLEEYEVALAKYKKWEETKICQRCGTFF